MLVPTHHVIVFGASGDLAKRKIYPALFSLHHDRKLPINTKVIGYARTNHTPKQFHEIIAPNISCRVRTPISETCSVDAHYFLDECDYLSGTYDKLDDLQETLHRSEAGHSITNRLFYLSLPPHVYHEIIPSLPSLFSDKGWNRVVIEKPFGSDLRSYQNMEELFHKHIPTESIYRMDHYLGKEIVENICTLRFANPILETVWNREHICKVEIRAWEEQGINNRGYFDKYGIVRDIVQNHLFQILALLTMEPSSDISAAKAKVLQAVQTIPSHHAVFGQYEGYHSSNANVSPNSQTETYASLQLRIDNDRWKGVPFFVTAGKGMSQRLVDVRIYFQGGNVLDLQVQPKEAIQLQLHTKTPGHDRLSRTPSTLQLNYEHAFPATYIPDAYEKLLLEAFYGNQGSFISPPELEQSWRILDHVLRKPPHVQTYSFGSNGPKI